ncbi:helix-turn-helix domain-containing protein [Legionella sp. D16C41]|uniref:helix-turn-helix domain-containing protein n=1 Tax=Legionella sp. D16C41 TaxID=3402688 RepID=UPI003AF80292
MNNQKKLNQASSIIQSLMQECRITEAELARQTQLPQTTINRLLLGGTTDPRANTLKPIADFFCVSIGQLCGFEPLPLNRIAGMVNTTNPSAWRFIPIIAWEQIKSWRFTQKTITPLQHKNWIGTERALSENSFALQSLAFMEPRFRKNSTLIIDSEAKYKDGHYIIIALDGIHPTVRKVLFDGSDVLLQSFDQSQPALKLDKEHTIYGTIVESRLDTYHD